MKKPKQLRRKKRTNSEVKSEQALKKKAFRQRKKIY